MSKEAQKKLQELKVQLKQKELVSANKKAAEAVLLSIKLQLARIC
jgi:hypothetical protein